MDGTSLNGASLSITEDLITKLKEVIPQAFTEDKIDLQRLQILLGNNVNTDAERYGLSWAGKSEAYKVLQSPSTATLIPNPDQSIDWDNAENIFIEGENLEVLKVLQKSYYGKVKMIYIDPPYNTGSDSFIYPDKFSETKEEYLKRIGDKDDEGFMMKEGLFRKNNKENGQYHSNWLNMMLPRLFLARNLLREDGVIFISIDDNEQANLKLLMDEIFGEENFIGLFVVNASPSAIDYGHLGKTHDYAFFYAKNIEHTITNQLNDENKAFKYSDSKGQFNIAPLYNGNVAFNPKTRPNLYYPFYVNPNNKIDEFYEISLEPKNGWEEVFPVFSKKEGIARVWRWGKSKAEKDLNIELVGHKTSEGEFRIVQKTRLTTKMVRSLLLDNSFASRRGTGDFEELFKGKIFSFPKPVQLLKTFIETGSTSNEIIIDFFAGSGTTAQAVMELNEEDGGNRKYICVQLPEKTDETGEAYQAGYKTIADISKARIEKVIEKITKERDGKIELTKYQNLGFRKYTLASSNFKIWRGDVLENEEDLIKQMQLFTTPQKENTRSENILWELLIKNGVQLTEKIECSTLQDGATIYYTANKKLAFVLDSYTDEVQTAVLALKPKNIICLDSLFHNNDNVKTNAQLKFEDNGVSFKTI
ncbi:MAG: site-specific DNA-methyltransferase [Arcicella sp.]|jgi:adenine-specific DNA-methyltransferase|nr:site-specific DNA-methyltransferase [Arcicella sp.]